MVAWITTIFSFLSKAGPVLSWILQLFPQTDILKKIMDIINKISANPNYPIVNLLQDIADHAQLRFPAGAAALRYGVLQKLAYGTVLFVLLPAMILSGLAMSPALDAAWPWLVDLFGGRQSARSVHFLAAMALVR